MSDAAEDFDALFDEVSSQRSQAATPAPVVTPSVSHEGDDLEALFDQVSAQQIPAQTPPTTAPSAEDDLEALFDHVSSASAQQVAAATGSPNAGSAASFNAENQSDNQSDKPMFDRLGGIVRQLHDSLRELGYDRSLADVAEQMTDSKGRLEYVASLTEQAANKVLNAIDEGLPSQDALSKEAKDIETRWTLLFDGKLSLEEFKLLAGDSRQFATMVTNSTEAEKARLMEIMMAQDFQDITGQIIKKIVAISTKLEHELAQLLRDNAPPTHKEKDKETKVDMLAGPNAAAMVQDDVDGLLADLGF